VEVLQGLRFAAFYRLYLRVLSRSCLFVPGLEQQTTQYPLRRQLTIVHEVFAVCQGREHKLMNYAPVARNRVFLRQYLGQTLNHIEKPGFLIRIVPD